MPNANWRNISIAASKANRRRAIRQGEDLLSNSRRNHLPHRSLSRNREAAALIPRCSPIVAANGIGTIMDKVASATWKIPAMQVAAKDCQNPNRHAHCTHRVHMIRMAKELMKYRDFSNAGTVCSPAASRTEISGDRSRGGNFFSRLHTALSSVTASRQTVSARCPVKVSKNPTKKSLNECIML